jgi:hypothetical protein
MPVTNWTQTVIDGKNYLVIDVAKLRIPLDWDPSSNVFIAVAAPTGGVMDYPALVQGDPGVTPDIDTVINFTALSATDPTPESASWTETAPNVYKLNLALRNGAAGANGTSVLNPAAYGTPVAKKILVVNGTADGFVYQTQKVGDRYFPASLISTPSGNAAYTLGVVSIGPLDFDWRPEPHAGCKQIAGTAADVQVDLIARLNDQAAGNIVGRGWSMVGTAPPPCVMVPGPPAGSADTYDKVAAGATASIYLRAERQSGTGTFTTAASDTKFWVKANPIP